MMPNKNPKTQIDIPHINKVRPSVFRKLTEDKSGITRSASDAQPRDLRPSRKKIKIENLIN